MSLHVCTPALGTPKASKKVAVPPRPKGVRLEPGCVDTTVGHHLHDMLGRTVTGQEQSCIVGAVEEEQARVLSVSVQVFHHRVQDTPRNSLDTLLGVFATVHT